MEFPVIEHTDRSQPTSVRPRALVGAGHARPAFYTDRPLMEFPLMERTDRLQPISGQTTRWKFSYRE